MAQKSVGVVATGSILAVAGSLAGVSVRAGAYGAVVKFYNHNGAPPDETSLVLGPRPLLAGESWEYNPVVPLVLSAGLYMTVAQGSLTFGEVLYN